MHELQLNSEVYEELMKTPECKLPNKVYSDILIFHNSRILIKEILH